MENPQQLVPKIKIPRSDYTIDQIGFGTYELKDTQCYTGTKCALETGYRHIDTASIYKNEQVIGQVIKDLQKDQVDLYKRENLFITSKISPYEQGESKSRQAIEDILKRLQLEYLDLVLIHWPGSKGLKPDDPKNHQMCLETWKVMEEYKQKGKIRSIGVSNFLVCHLELLIKNSQVVPQVNQFELHPLCINHQLIEFCKKNEILIQAYTPLAKNDDRLMKNPTILQLAQKYNKTTAQIALKWGIQNQFIVLPKSQNPERIKQNFQIFDFEMENNEIQQISQLNNDFHFCWNPNTIYPSKITQN